MYIHMYVSWCVGEKKSNSEYPLLLCLQWRHVSQMSYAWLSKVKPQEECPSPPGWGSKHTLLYSHSLLTCAAPQECQQCNTNYSQCSHTAPLSLIVWFHCTTWRVLNEQTHTHSGCNLDPHLAPLTNVKPTNGRWLPANSCKGQI